MGDNRHNIRLVKDVPLIIIGAVLCTALLAYWDVYEWFYLHSRPYEAYNYDEIVVFLSLFLIIGLLWLVYRLYRNVLCEIKLRRKSENTLRRLNQELDQRAAQRTVQLQRELEMRKCTEQDLVMHQQQLRSVSAELALVQERERHRIAADLHDHIGHALVLASNRLGTLGALLSADQDKALVDDIRQLIKQSIRYSRSLIAELGSPLYHQVSFVSAVEWLARDILDTKCIALRLQVDEQSRLPSDNVQVLFFRVIEEILVNIVKHAEAHHVDITLGTENGNLTVEICDDGVGFDVHAVLRARPGDRHGFGIFMIRERLTHLNGRCSITSQPGQGTSVILMVPVKHEMVESCKT
jgi:signal transduction histidine kinase